MRFDYAANYHTVGAGLKPALPLPRDANPVTRIWPSILLVRPSTVVMLFPPV